MKKIQLIIERGPDKKFWGRILIEDNLIVDSAETVGELDLKMKALLNQFHDMNIRVHIHPFALSIEIFYHLLLEIRPLLLNFLR
jgi:hypothetical protein